MGLVLVVDPVSWFCFFLLLFSLLQVLKGEESVESFSNGNDSFIVKEKVLLVHQNTRAHRER